MLGSFPILIGLATLIYAGAWMIAAPSRALTVVNKVSSEVRRLDRNIFWQGPDPMRESGPIRAAFRIVGLALIFLSLMRLMEIT
jgi:hypothetical protein